LNVSKLRLEKGPAPAWVRPVIPLLAIMVTFIITLVFIFWVRANPLHTYYYFLIAPFTSTVTMVELLVKATPLFLTGAAVAFAFRAGYYNIGAEGQLTAGAIMGAWLGVMLHGTSPWVALPVMIIGGFLGGVVWALIPALLRVKLKVDEVVTTLLMNSVIVFLVSYLLNGPWRDPISMWPQSPDIAESAMFFTLISRSRLHFGFILGIITILVIWFIISSTAFGLKMRAAGSNAEAARFAGVDVERTILVTALVSGGIAGLAGVSEVAGIHFHLIQDLSSNLGYTGIIVATLGALNPLGVGIAALFIGLIDTGSLTVSRALGVPVYLGQVVQAALLLVTLGMFVLTNYRLKREG
jgi:general nucleoside transport system permease protein